MKPWSRLAVVAFVSLSACQTTQSKRGASATAPKASDSPFLVRQNTFTQCELEGFISMNAARNALVFKSTKESLLDSPGDGTWQRAMIEELFARKESGLKNPARFAADKFYECADRERLSLALDIDGASICLARLDIVFYLDADRRKGQTQAEAVAHFKRIFRNAPVGLFPDDLIDQLAPMVFRVSSDDGEYELRRLVFESCLFPKEWRRWWDTEGRTKA